MEIFQEWIFEQIAQTGVVLPARSFQPFESLVLVPPIRVSLGNLERSCFGFINASLVERRVGLLSTLLSPARATHDEEPCPFTRISLRLGCRLFEFILQQIG